MSNIWYVVGSVCMNVTAIHTSFLVNDRHIPRGHEAIFTNHLPRLVGHAHVAHEYVPASDLKLAWHHKQ